ncbi:MAG: type II toxin-antitoxin system VapC family toxin [Planctomycetes bacterium]|nr:type II toxin-antitoxin system VapC family toxin [Planctomycetota bacterium]
MKPTVLDAHAVLVYLQGEPARETVRDLLALATQEGTMLLLTSVNAGEVFYRTVKRHGAGKLAEVEAHMALLPIELVPVDLALAREAALLKATKKMSYADCFAAALAKMRGGRVVTGDPEFREVEAEIPILWLTSSQGT